MRAKAVNEERFQKQKFTSTPVKEGDIYYDCINAKAGYYNYRVIKKIEGNYATVEIWDTGVQGKGHSLGRPHTVSLESIQKCVDKVAKEKLEQGEIVRKMVHQISQKIGLGKIAGGSLSNPSTVKELKRALLKLRDASEKFRVADKSTPAGGFSGANSATMTSSQSGTPIRLEFNDVHRGGYYAGSTPFLVQIQVGGGLDYNLRKALLEVGKNLLKKFTYETDWGKSSVRDTDGTNWSSVMLTAPQKYEEGGSRFQIIKALEV